MPCKRSASRQLRHTLNLLGGWCRPPALRPRLGPAAGGPVGSASGASLLVHALAESLAALPRLADERDRDQVEGITRLAKVLQVRGARSPGTTCCCCAAVALLSWAWGKQERVCALRLEAAHSEVRQRCWPYRLHTGPPPSCCLPWGTAPKAASPGTPRPSHHIPICLGPRPCRNRRLASGRRHLAIGSRSRARAATAPAPRPGTRPPPPCRQRPASCSGWSARQR